MGITQRTYNNYLQKNNLPRRDVRNITNEEAIMKQLKEKGIPTEKELENTKSKNYQNEDGHWITINGTHVFIED